MVLVLALYALFASSFTIGKTALQYSQPFFLIGSRMLAAGLIMLSYEWICGKETWKMSRKEILGVGCLGFFNIYLTNICEFWGLQYLTTFKTCFIYSLSPFLSAILCYLLFKEKLTNKKWLGLAVGFAGFFPILLSQSTGEELSGQFFLFSWAELSVVVAAISSVYGWILLGRLVKERSPLMINGFSMVLGGALALIHSSIYENWSPIPVTEVFPFLECTILLMVVSNLIAYNLYGYLLKKYSPTFLSFAGFSTPIFTVLFGWYFLGEVASLPFYISASVVFVGLFLFHQEELTKSTESQKVTI